MEVPLFLAAEALAEEVASAEALVAVLVVVAAPEVVFNEHISRASVPYGCFLHQTAPRNFLICVKQTAELLACLAQKSLRKTHSLNRGTPPRYALAEGIEN